MVKTFARSARFYLPFAVGGLLLIALAFALGNIPRDATLKGMGIDEFPQVTRVSFKPFSGTLYCPECALDGIKINLWKNPDRTGLAGSLPHNTRVDVLDRAYSSAGILHYRVSGNAVTGWVSEDFVRH